MENVLEALKKHSKQKPTRKSQFLNPYGVMVYNIVDGPSKLFCNLLPYLKTKKKRFDYDICEAVNDNSVLPEIDMR